MVVDPTKTTLIRSRVLRSIVSNYIGNFIVLGTGFLLTPFILHQLGDATYGLWVLVGSVVAYGGLLELGIAGAVTKYVAEYRVRGEVEQARSLVATALSFYTVLGLIAIVLTLLVAPLFPQFFNVSVENRETVFWLVLLMGTSVGISIPCATSGAIFRGLQRFDLVNLITAIGTLLSAAATIVILLFGGGLIGMIASSIPIIIAMQGLSIWLIYRIAPELRFGWRGAKRSLVRPIISFSSSLFTMNVAGRLQTKTDEIVIGAFLPISAVTPYAIARRLSELPKLVTDQLLKVLMPLASELHAENDQVRLRALYLTGTRLTMASFLPIACTLIILADAVLTLWVGAAYAPYGELVVILTLASLIDTSQWPGGSVLQGMARHRQLAIMSIGSGIANLILSLLLVPRFGITGAALGTLIPTSVECIAFVLPYAMRTIGVRPIELIKEVVLPVTLPILPMLLTLYIARQIIGSTSLLSLTGLASISILVYIVMYVSFGASKLEQQTYRGILLNTLRMGSRRFKSL